MKKIKERLNIKSAPMRKTLLSVSIIAGVTLSGTALGVQFDQSIGNTLGDKFDQSIDSGKSSVDRDTTLYFNPYNNEWKASFLNGYADLLDAIPSPRSIATNVIKDGLAKKHLPAVDPTKTYYNVFNAASNNSHSFNGWQHNRTQLKSSSTMTEAALLNTFNQWQDDYPGEMDAYTGLYTVGKDADIYNEFNDVNILSTWFWDIIYYDDIQGKYDKALNKFWSENHDTFVHLTREAYKFSAYQMDQEGDINREQYVLIMDAINNQDKTKVYWFDIYGYYSNDIFVIESANDDNKNVILYIPGSEPSFKAFSNENELRFYIKNLLSTKEHRDSLARHFSLYDRQDGSSYSGVDSAFKGIANASWNESYIMYKKHSRIDGDIFEHVAESTKNRLSSDGDIKIRSNREAENDYVLRVVNTIFNIFPIIDFIVPEIGLPVGIALSATQAGISIDKAINGDSTEERDQAIVGSVLGSVALAASTIIPIASKFASSIREAADELVPPEGTILNTLPDGFNSIKVGDNIRVVENPLTREELSIVRLKNEDRVVAIKKTPFNYYSEIDWSTGTEISGTKVYRTLNPESNEWEWITKGGLRGGAANHLVEEIEVVSSNRMIQTRTPGISLDGNKITVTSDHSEYFHGSKSSSLISLSERRKVLPLSDTRLPEEASIEKASATDLDNSGYAYDYSFDSSAKGKFNLESSQHEAELAESQLKNYNVDESVIQRIKSGDDISIFGLTGETQLSAQKLSANTKLIEHWQGLSSTEKDLVNQDFPVMYGFFVNDVNDIQNIKSVTSSIPGEVEVQGGIKSKWISVIYTTPSKTQLVKDYLSDAGLSSIEVHEFDDIHYSLNQSSAEAAEYGGSLDDIKKIVNDENVSQRVDSLQYIEKGDILVRTSRINDELKIKLGRDTRNKDLTAHSSFVFVTGVEEDSFTFRRIQMVEGGPYNQLITANPDYSNMSLIIDSSENETTGTFLQHSENYKIRIKSSGKEIISDKLNTAKLFNQAILDEGKYLKSTQQVYGSARDGKYNCNTFVSNILRRMTGEL
ncbi:dermonecrotic toxin domain-containing protein [Shewanella sp. YLB-07]|uniref:dermonecrotic toxin domain-containing protein n=1 Tax=Shewanella sp. YLB-07 TaxID=2601268 RepID=UPI00128C3688|nr:DUF6543 domain-containing protein [Shewanella sp. YLB-07]MPY24544.1 hypothetical protein [Shewanella sp. YLB-07]